ncbi:hypothetical protein PC128_g3438 [Phytophthora cactorum]|nr:hypothetical protein PC128_g3438 [Phytophthora cactorum]
MSVAPRAAPSISDRSKILSRRGSHRNEEELAVGAVIVMLSDKSDDHSAAAYRLSTRDSSHGDSKLISTATTQKEQSFVAVLAPNCDAAMASLLTQPPGTFLLVKEEDSAIAVYVKFRQAVRALTLVKSKDVKKNDNAIHLAKLRKKELDVTPVHNLRLPSEWYFLVEHCWKRFLPQVQAVVFELCCESHLDEETRLEDWTSSMIPQPAYSVGLMPEACGFYILSVPGNGADSSSVVQVRQVEFDFNKFALTVADGTHKPSALLLATSFSAKRTYEPDFTFGAIRDNFLTPDLVILKETSVNTIPSQQSSLQNCIDLSTNDKELAVLNAADAACCSIMPHEPLPDSLLAVLHEMHICFVNTAVRDGTIPSSKPAHWSTQKKKLVGRIIPILLELLISSATSSEADHVDVHKKRQTLAQFARAIRELNERLQLDATCDDQIGESEMEDTAQVQEADDNFLNALAEVLSWIPKVLLDEWMVLCLKELLQTVNNLSNVVKQTAVPQLKQLRYIRYGYEICKVFAVVLKRASDPDIQVLLVRVLGTDCAAIISLLSFILAPHSLSINGGRDADCIQVNVLNFLSAFVNLDIALPVQTDWESKNSKPSGEDSMNEDAEVIEQLKGELLIRLIGPRMTLEEEQNDQTLWDFVLELMFPKNSVVNYDGTSCMISMAVSFRSLSVPPNLLTTISREYFQLKVAFLSLQQALYTAQDVSLPIDYVHCVASHWRRIEQYCDRIIENEGQEELSMVRRIVELNFRCLVVLASRRSQFPAIQDALSHNRVLSCVLQRLQRVRPSLDEVTSRSQGDNSGSLGSNSIPCLPPLKLPRQLSADSSDVSGLQPGMAKLSLSSPQSWREEVNIDENFILLEPGLHVLAIALVVTYIIIDPNLEIDERLCPRISVSDQVEDSNRPNELLWKLQQHLAAVDMDQRYFEALMVEMKTLQAFVSTARLSAIRSLLRLLCPNRFDSNIYTSQDNEQREYIAKGAFSTVYRQHSAFSKSEFVAVKIVEHQRRAGELCAVSGLYNEVSILSKLRGDLAATQLVDFGNYHQEQNFEIVMEYCTCSLTEWRETIKRAGAQVSFRSCLILILRAFEEACHCLTRIHKAGICHFDIKSDNILVRSSAHELSRRLLQNNETGKRSNNFKGWLCFADFGEAKCVDTDRIPVRTFTFSSFSSNAASPVVEKRVEKFMSLTRTRGTEAIKSPEVLKIKGSEVAVKVTLASDIWSLGCLLYELVTQELLFQNDDWAGLYAHLVVTQDQHVLRSDHKQKMVTALNPTTSDEEAVVMNLLELCCNILVREPTRRPKLEMIVAQVCNLINDVYALPLTTSDESFTSLCQLNTENLVPEAVPEFRPFTTAPSCRKRVETHGVIVPVRLFWNFFLAAEVTKTQDTQKVASCVGHGENIMAIDVFESKYEDNFVHFVYLSWHESGDSNVHKVSQFFEEIHEEKHRTCFLLNAQLSTDLHLFQQHAAQHFPVIQRRLRDEAGCVVFVALGKDEEDSKTLQGILTNILCFFFRSVVNMSVFDILSCFARECAQFFEYPKPEFLKQLMAYSNTRAEDTETSTMVQCRCGAIVFSVEAAVVAEALTKHSFKPFDENVDDEYPVDTMFVHDNAEEKLVLPLETRGNAIQWVVLDTVSVTRGSTPPIITSDRRMSRFGILKRQASNAEDTATAEPQDLVRGLQRGKNSPSSDMWEMYECELCRLPICALSEDRLKVALPMLHPHSKD